MTTRRLQALISLSIAQVEGNVDAFLERLNRRIEDMQVNGVSQKEIAVFISSQAVQEALYRSLLNDIARTIDTSLNQLETNAYLDVVGDLAKKWRWNYEPTAEHCDTCIDNNGKVRTMQYWQTNGVPGAGTTICDGGCRCWLEPVE